MKLSTLLSEHRDAFISSNKSVAQINFLIMLILPAVLWRLFGVNALIVFIICILFGMWMTNIVFNRITGMGLWSFLYLCDHSNIAEVLVYSFDREGMPQPSQQLINYVVEWTHKYGSGKIHLDFQGTGNSQRDSQGDGG